MPQQHSAAPALPPGFIEGLVDLANATAERMDGTTGPVIEIITENDVVFGVWQDPSERHGVGLLLVKGANRLRDIAATGIDQSCRISAIKCISAEQAEALRQHVATDPTH
jgi:hypothetical protein